jgi:UDP-glucose:(heptosyl)LPS alpha-1,3-glucosyltransferase
MNAVDPRLRIAFVVHDYNQHIGHSRYVVELASRFRHHHEVHVFANSFDEADAAGLTYHHVPAWRANALASVLSFVLPATVLVRGRFDIVHAQGLCGLRHNVSTAHFCLAGWHDALVRANGRLTWRQRVWHAAITPLERLALAKRSTRRVIAISERVRDDLARHYGRRDGMRLIYHGVDLDRFHPGNRECWRMETRRALGIAPGECLALYVGNLQKGGAAAIQATARVPRVRLVLVSGSNPAAERALARAEGAADRVSFQPPSKQIERCFAAADLFVFPTMYDSFGMVISEAMAAGLPVVTNRSAGAAELIEHGQSGWLTTDPWDPGPIAAAMRALEADQALRERIGRAARRRIEAYTWDRVAEETLSVYREILAETAERTTVVEPPIACQPTP